MIAGHPQPGSASSHAPPLIVWLIIQLAALILCAARVPLWARPSQPLEQYSLQIMLAVQMAASALLAPMLFASGQRSCLVIAATVPFVALASVLSRDDMVRLWPAVAL